MKYRFLLLGGALAPAVYVAAVTLGGLIQPGYSHLSQAVSELTARGAPNKNFLDIFFIVYNLLLVAFGIGLGAIVRSSGTKKEKTSGIIGTLILIIIARLGLVMIIFFPRDPTGAPLTTAGNMRTLLTIIATLGTMVVILLLGLWFRSHPRLRGFSKYSLVTFIVVFVAGGITAASAATGGSLLGLVERLTVGAYIQWLFVVSIKMYSDERLKHALATQNRPEWV
jgi:hypothetical protein